MNRAYVYVDGENHFLRSTAAAATAFGRPNAAELVAQKPFMLGAVVHFPQFNDGHRFRWRKECSFFWDSRVLSIGGGRIPSPMQIVRSVYVTACTGDAAAVHAEREFIRNSGFEPLVIQEDKAKFTGRVNTLLNSGMMEKPKGCDVALAVRMVADASNDLYDMAFLFTTDADFLPVVETVRQMGKVVYVFGFKEVLPALSPYLYVPDRFIDLGFRVEELQQIHRPEYDALFS